MKRLFPVLLCFLLLLTIPSFAGNRYTITDSSVNIIELSQQLLLSAKRHETTDSLSNIFSQLSDATLQNQLPDDTHKKAFWINLYNAYTQILLFKNPDRYTRRGSFFGSREINIAGKSMSLDDIEHGILRRSKIKWSEGYLNKWFPSAFEKKHRVTMVDYRIHFTLNCGATSCPPIAFYKPEQLEKQLELATKTFLKGESVYDTTNNTILLPTMMSWFRADFGGKKEMRKLLQRIGIITAEQNPSIKFKKYNWNLFLENYKPTNDG